MSRFSSTLPLCLLIGAVSLAFGCQRAPKTITGAQIRSVTREFVLAARNASDGAAQTGMEPERIPGTPQTQVVQGRRGGTPLPPSVDMIFITIPGDDAAARQQLVDAVDQEIDRVGQAHGLHRVPRPGTSGVIRFDYFFGAQHTHSIDIILPILSNSQAHLVPASDRKPKLAIILDDLGYDRAAADAILQIPYPLTLSVLPMLPHSSEIAEDAFRRGYQVMLHLPVESDSGTKAENIQLQPGMPANQVGFILENMLETVPHAVGVNNHQGSLGTSDESLMSEIMPALHDRDLYFVDSRTSPRSIAFDAARKAHVPAAARDIFLDDAQDVSSIQHQLDLAAREARERGTAIAIGHPHPETIEALTQALPQLQREGVELIFASQAVR